MSHSCSKLFTPPHAAVGPAILQFAPEAGGARVCKAWNSRMNELLERWWNTLPPSLQAEKEAAEKKCSGEKLSYSHRFECLNAAFSLELQKLHPKTTQEMARRFRGSLSVTRILSKEAKILRLNLFNSRLLLDRQCGKVKLKVFEFAADYRIPEVCKAWRGRMSRILCKYWWTHLPKSLVYVRSDMYYKLPENERSYYALFHTLTDRLSEQLTRFDPRIAHDAHREFRGSISPMRVIALQELIVHRRCMLDIWHQATAQAKKLAYIEKDTAKVCRQFLKDSNSTPFSQVFHIDIRGMNLTKVPVELVRFSDLQDLNLALNDLKTIHPFVSYLPHLRRVDLQGNPFAQENYLPIARIVADHVRPSCFLIDIEPLKLVVKHEIELAGSLKAVWKRIKVNFPEKLGKLYSDVKSRGHILPSEIRSLLLDPANRKFLDKVSELDLRGCGIRALAPEIFLTLRRLKKVDLSQNRLRELPYNEMEALEQLEHLDLSHTDFSPSEYDTIAQKLADFPALTTVIHDSPHFKFETILNLKKKSSSMKQQQASSSAGRPGGSKACAIL